MLSVCHTVLPSMETGTLQYNAQSPDEAALVTAAKNFGYVFKVRTITKFILIPSVHIIFLYIQARSPFTLTVDMLNKGKDSEV